MRLYKYFCFKYGLTAILDQRIKVSRFADMNDPFEMLSAALDDDDARDLIPDRLEAIDFHTGALCFSQSDVEPLLWAHYADKHRGVCLGFDVLPDINMPRAEKLFPMEYQPERLRGMGKQLMQGTADEFWEIQRLLWCTQYERWAYEEEFRLTTVLQYPEEYEYYYKPFDQYLQLREVLLGVRFDLNRIRDFTEALTKMGIVPIRMQLDAERFAIVRVST